MEIKNTIDIIVEYRYFKYLILFLSNIIPGTIYLYQINSPIIYSADIIRFLLFAFFYSLPHFILSFILLKINGLDLYKLDTIVREILSTLQQSKFLLTKVELLHSETQPIIERVNSHLTEIEYLKYQPQYSGLQGEIHALHLKATEALAQAQSTKSLGEDNIRIAAKLQEDTSKQYAYSEAIVKNIFVGLIITVVFIQLLTLFFERLPLNYILFENINSFTNAYVFVYTFMFVSSLILSFIINTVIRLKRHHTKLLLII